MKFPLGRRIPLYYSLSLSHSPYPVTSGETSNGKIIESFLAIAKDVRACSFDRQLQSKAIGNGFIQSLARLSAQKASLGTMIST